MMLQGSVEHLAQDIPDEYRHSVQRRDPRVVEETRRVIGEEEGGLLHELDPAVHVLGQIPRRREAKRSASRCTLVILTAYIGKLNDNDVVEAAIEGG